MLTISRALPDTSCDQAIARGRRGGWRVSCRKHSTRCPTRVASRTIFVALSTGSNRKKGE